VNDPAKPVTSFPLAEGSSGCGLREENSGQVPTGPVLRIESLAIALPTGADRAHAVEGVDLRIAAGKVLCLVGESGSGKSVIAQAVMGLLPRNVRPVAGHILLGGEDLLRASPQRLRQLRGVRASMIFQEPMTALNPVMRCGTQVDELLREHTELDAGARRARVLQIFEHVRLPDPARIYASYPHQLSGGQRQRVMIAMALILKPALLIADEPTTALDVTTQAEILKLMRELQRENDTAVLFITHDFGVVSEIADEVAVLQRGQLVEQGAAQQVLRAPQHEYTRMLLAAVPSLTPRKQAPDSAAKAAPALAVRGLSKIYHGGSWWRRHSVTAAEDIHLEVRRGETLGVVGESGSGKSTLARLVAHLVDASGGTATLYTREDGRAVGPNERDFRRRVQIVFQDPYRSLNPRRTVGAALIEGPMNFGATRAAAWRRAEELMTLVRLSPDALKRYPHEFSGGQRQRICIARALACEPELLIADEAVSALDVSVQAHVLRLLDEIRLKLNLTMLFITHDLRVAAQICDRVVVMQHGRVVEQGDVAEIFQRPRHAYTRALLAAAPGRHYEFGPRRHPGGSRDPAAMPKEPGSRPAKAARPSFARPRWRG
jgi:peptide/nickel transport system ATP-binding protein